MANGKAQGGRATKAERRDEARRQRIERERAQARARRNRRIAIVVAVVVVAGAAAAYALTRPKTEPTPGAAKLLAAGATEAKAAGCSKVSVVGPYQPENLDRAHIGASGGPAQMPPLASYPSQPPTSGPHAEAPLDAGVYSSPPPMDQAIHSLEHGAAIVWYAPGASDAELSKIRDFYRSSDVGSRVIVAPYDYSDEGAAGALPSGTEMALVSWHHLETCASPNLAAAFAFTARYAAPPFDGQDYLGDAPEPGAAI